MTMPLMKPRRKNPVLRTRQMNLPPWARGRTALGMTAAAAEGRFELQVCQRCAGGAIPAARCLPSLPVAATEWTAQTGAGELLSETVLHHSNDPFYRERLPWRLGLVRLDAGPTVIVHLHGDVPSPPPQAPTPRRIAAATPVRVHVGARLDRAGAAVLIGFPPEESEHMADDKMLREMTSDPKFRKILVTDGKTEVGQALVQGAREGRRRHRLGRPCRAVEEAARPRRHQRAAAGDAGAARPDQRPLGRPSWPARSAARSTS